MVCKKKRRMSGFTGMQAGTEDFEVIEVSSGERRTIDVFDDYDGQMENILIDQTADNSVCRISAQFGGDFTIRNVGIRGTYDREDDENQIKPGVSDGKQGVIENVYIGDGASDNSQNNGILVDADTTGTMTFRNVHVGYFADNGIYGANSDGNATIQIENCYGENNNISQFRIGGPESYIRDSVAYISDQDEVPPARPGSLEARGLRIEYHDHEVENTHVLNEAGWPAVDYERGGCATYRNCEISGSPDFDGSCDDERINTGDNPDPTPPEGVPMSAEEAAGGTSTAGSVSRSSQSSSNRGSDSIC
jgi:hypothetical protein